MFKIDSNQTIKMSKGDDVKFPVFLNQGTSLTPLRYPIYENMGCELYFSIYYRNDFDNPILKKTFKDNGEIVTEKSNGYKSVKTGVDNINDKILDVKELTSLSQVKIYLRKLNELKNIEQIKSHNTKAIINGLTKTNVDKGTDCTFHLYNVRDVLGNKIYCYCRYCSCEKIFTKDEWDDYCIKYRKWF